MKRLASESNYWSSADMMRKRGHIGGSGYEIEVRANAAVRIGNIPPSIDK